MSFRDDEPGDRASDYVMPVLLTMVALLVASYGLNALVRHFL